MLVAMKELLDEAVKNNKAVAAINVSNMETVSALLETAQKRKENIIIQVAPIQMSIQKLRYKQIVKIIEIFMEEVNIKAAIHLDHAITVKDCIEAIDAGFTSVMYDGSLGDYDENIKNTSKVVTYARKRGVTVEAELGKVGGTEGEYIETKNAQNNHASKNILDNSMMTNPNQVVDFLNKTGVDCLAVAIGNAHGLYKSEPKLDFDRLIKISELSRIPLVLHGGTGISEKDIDMAIDKGIRKINFFTDVDRAYVKGFVEAYEKDKNIYMMSAQEEARQLVMIEIDKKMKMCNRSNS